MTNSDTNIDVLANFQPMPKRFMVRDKLGGRWLYSFDDDDAHEYTIFDITELDEILDENGCSWDEVIIVQSTNLFDKDGKEIFEGSIVDYNDNGDMLGFVRQHEGQWYLENKYGNLLFLKGVPHQKMIGHILSNPELMEEKNV